MQRVPYETPYPIQLKEHGVDFLLDHRHLWIRTPRQAAILRIRASRARRARKFMDTQGYILTEAPIFTLPPARARTTLFEVQYIDDEKAYLTQSGQLYVEATAMALGKVYTFGPTLRAEKSKTRRHLTEFWMLVLKPPTRTWKTMELGEGLVCHVVRSVLKNRPGTGNAWTRHLQACQASQLRFRASPTTKPFKFLQQRGNPAKWGDDFGGDGETILSSAYDRPVMVHRIPPP